MRVWYDAEFSTTAPDIGLVSLGAVIEDGREFYAVSTEFDAEAAHPWVKKNVLPQLPPPGDPAWMSRIELREALLRFLGAEPVLWAWYGAYDHVALCQLWGSMPELPRALPRVTLDVRQLWEHLGRPPLPVQDGGLHHALDDARHVKVRWEALAEKAYRLGLEV
ncbi:MAG: polyadenylate-specific 3'-exoribonuclease AS [Mycobacteriales bacterium]